MMAAVPVVAQDSVDSSSFQAVFFDAQWQVSQSKDLLVHEEAERREGVRHIYLTSLGSPVGFPDLLPTQQYFLPLGYVMDEAITRRLNYMIQGPMPVVTWRGQSAHGQGQDFGLVAAMSVSPRSHWMVDFSRMHAYGLLRNEFFFQDYGSVWHDWQSEDGERRFRAKLDVVSGHALHSGGVVDPDEVDSLVFENQTALMTQWTDAESNYAHLGLDMRYSWRSMFIQLDAQRSHRYFQVPSEDISDSLWGRHMTVSAGAGDSTYLALGLRHRLQWSGESTEQNGPITDPFIAGRIHLSRGGNLDGRFFLRSRTYHLKYLTYRGVSIQSRRELLPLWMADLVPAYTENKLELNTQAIKLTYATLSATPVLRGDQWLDEPYWDLRDPMNYWRVDGGDDLELHRWILSFRGVFAGASSRDAAIPALTLKGAVTRVWKVGSDVRPMRLKLGVNSMAWSGGWKQPFYDERVQQFVLPSSELLAEPGMLVHFTASVEMPQAEIQLQVQNANQGWMPNAVFMASHYPQPPLTVRLSGKWRMFN